MEDLQANLLPRRQDQFRFQAENHDKVSSQEHASIMKDMKLLLQHRDEIREIKKSIKQYQEKSTL